MYQKLLVSVLCVFAVVGCGGGGSVAHASNPYVGLWHSPCFASPGDSKIEYKFDGKLFSIYLIDYEDDSNCEGAVEAYDEIQSLGYDLGEFVTTRSGISAQVLTMYGESSRVKNLIFRDGGSIYIGWHEDEEQPSDVNLLDPFFLQ